VVLAGLGRRTSVSPMPAVLLATDADWLYDEVEAALGNDEITVYRVHRGVDVLPALLEVDAELAILDLQIGNMGGMATCMSIRNEEGMSRLPITAVLMLLDRGADEFLAHRSDADGWLFKPLDAFRLRRAAQALLDGGTWFEGVDEHALATGVEAIDLPDPRVAEDEATPV
jgi:DNA-binding response OmpR family regulator